MSWNNTTLRRFIDACEDPNAQVVFIEDGVEPYCRLLVAGETLADACREFASTYDDGVTIVVPCTAELYSMAAGEAVEARRFTIQPSQPME